MTKQLSIAAFVQSGEKRASRTVAETERGAKRKRLSNSCSFEPCPLCGVSFARYKLESHASDCNGIPKTKTESCSNILKVSCEPLPGLFVYDDFISPEEEETILARLEGNDMARSDEYLPWTPSNINGKHLGKRWGAHCTVYGLKSNQQKSPLPHFIESLIIPKLRGLHTMKGIVPDEANAIEYKKELGHFLKAHVDDRKLAEEPIANISLAGDSFMTFKNIAPDRNTAVTEKKVLLKRRCLQIMTGKARYDFTHAIDNCDLLSPRRVSLTLRRATAPPSIQQPLAPQQSWWNKSHPTQPVNALQPSISEPIPGLFLFDSFLTEDEEDEIMNALDNSRQLWSSERHTGKHFERRFGVDHDIWSKHLRPASHPMPDWFVQIVLPKLKKVPAMFGCIPNEMNVIEYKRSRGDYLKSHMDDRVKYKEPIANLSLVGDCFMMFGKERDPSQPKKRILLRRRTLQVLTGKARYEWTHGIESQDILSERRVSVTMRETVGKV